MWLIRRCLCVLGVLFYIIAAVRTSSAVEVSGRSSTQLLWFNDIVDASKHLDLAEYLRVSINSIDKAGKLSVNGYGRLVYDLKQGGEVEDRLYYFFADYKGFLDKADIRLGRQFVNLSAGSALVDGAQADVKNIGPVGIVVMGGRNVLFGEDDALTSHSYVLGAAAYLTGVKKTDLDVSYFRVYDFSDVARDIVGASFKQYLLNSVKIYANARYDLTAEVFNELLGGIKYFPTLDLILTAEYFQSFPTFDTTSIFSVFAVNKYREDVLRADYTVTQWLDVSAGYNHENFGEGATANVYEVGFRLRPSMYATFGAFYDSRRGFGGNLNGYRVYAEYSTFKKWKGAAGIDFDVYERDNMTGQATARRYWVAGRYKFSSNMSSTVRVEDNVNVNFSKDIQGRVTFDYDF